MPQPTVRAPMLLPLKHFLLALQFLTRIPVRGRLGDWVGWSPQMLRASSAYFPAVGWLVGAWAGLVFWASLALLPAQPAAPWVAAALSTAASLWLTGAFHEDGLADTADGLGGGHTLEQRLSIMKDSRIGSFGAAALVLALVLKMALLALLAQAAAGLVPWALATGHAVSRLAPLVVMRAMVHQGDRGGTKSKPLADGISRHALALGAGWSALALAVVWQLGPAPSGAGLWLAALAGAAVGLSAMAQLQWRSLRGYTGDTLGATQQISELGFYLGLALALGAA